MIKFSNLFVAIVTALMLTAAAASPAVAHGMFMETRDDGEIFVRYDDNTPARAIGVRLYDEDDILLDSGATDAEGVFKFDPSINPHRAVAEDGMGHRAEWIKGRSATIEAIPLWVRVLLGVGILLFIGAVFYFRGLLKQEAE